MLLSEVRKTRRKKKKHGFFAELVKRQQVEKGCPLLGDFVLKNSSQGILTGVLIILVFRGIWFRVVPEKEFLYFNISFIEEVHAVNRLSTGSVCVEVIYS